MIGPKTKMCTVVIMLYPSLLTWLVLNSSLGLKVQVGIFTLTVLMSYITIVVLQDYFWLKSHPAMQNQRRDLHIVKPLITKAKKGAK